MLNFFILRRFRKIIIAAFMAIILTGGSGDIILNYLAASGDIYDYTILKVIYENKEEIKKVLDKVTIEDIVTKIDQTKELIKEGKDLVATIKKGK